jgi:FAD binding domain/Berberine and berberine like
MDHSGPAGHAISERDWRSLAGALPDGGRLFRPGDRGYASTRPVSNQRYAGVLHGGVAACRGAGDIAAAVAWARDRNLPFALRSGGHSYAGYSSTTGLLIDLSGLADISVDPAAGEVTVGTGVTQAQLHHALRRYGRTFPAGRCPTVAMGGLILGGGIGFSCRMFGLACDSLLSTDLLTASGELVRCSPDLHTDLFWACRGGAGGSFGVNTSFTLRTQVAARVTLFELSWPLCDARSVLAAVQEIAREAPGEFGIRADVVTSGSCPEEAAKRAHVRAIGQFLGPRGELERLLAPVLAPAPGLGCRIRECDYWEAVESFADQPPVFEFAVKSRMVTGTLPGEAVDLLVAEITRWPGSQNEDGACAALFALGGAVGRVAPDATAFVHRDAAFILALETNWTGSDPRAVSQAGLDWLDRLCAQLAPYTADAAYQNFPDPELKNWRTAYYGTNYGRLAEVKRAYDPDNIFKFEQSID